MLNRKMLRDILAIVSAWTGLVVVPFFIPEWKWSIKIGWCIFASAAISIFVVVYFLLSAEPESKFPLKEVRLSASHELQTTIFNLTVLTGPHRIKKLEALVSYGYGGPTKWANLDLREHIHADLKGRKMGRAKKSIPLAENDQKTFTLTAISLSEPDPKGMFFVTGTDEGFFFKNVYWFDPSPELYIKFVGVTEPAQKEYVVSVKRTPYPRVVLYPSKSAEALSCIAEREQLVGKRLSDKRITCWNRNESLGVTYAFVGDEKLLAKVRANQVTISDFPDRVRKRFRS